jgi:hypothetical protein
MTPHYLHTMASAAAQKAVDDLIAKHGSESNAFFYCGFAWVKITPARGPFVKFLKEQKIGDRGWNGGYEVRPEITYPEKSACWQSMDLREAAAEAYAKVLKEAGLTCYMQSRAD